MRWVARVCFLILVAFTIKFAPANAHEVNPAYLEITETTSGQYSVVWKQPVKDGRRLKIDPVFPAACEKEDIRVNQAPGIIVERWQTSCDLDSGSISITGLDRTLTDVFVRVERSDSNSISAVLKAGRSSVDLSTPQGVAVFAYLWLGVEHIIFGYDHLLFVLGLVLLLGGKKIIPTVTAFTVAHSITLALSTLANISLPGPPVEIVIALSLVLLAREMLENMRGKSSLSVRYPWVIAFGFGLIHGFGFAGALSQIGLPSGAEALALGLFNIGVEAGQLGFVLAILTIGWVVAQISKKNASFLQTASTYLVGVAGVYWVIERVVSIAMI